jgi:hypothetical protein
MLLMPLSQGTPKSHTYLSQNSLKRISTFPFDKEMFIPKCSSPAQRARPVPAMDRIESWLQK